MRELIKDESRRLESLAVLTVFVIAVAAYIWLQRSALTGIRDFF